MSIYRRDTKNKPRWKEQYAGTPNVPYISKGYMTLEVPMTVFCENRNRLVQELRNVRPRALVVIQAASHASCSSRSSHVQDSFFFWAFGCSRSQAMGAIDIVSNKSYLIVLRGRGGGSEWCERRLNRKQIKKQFFVDGVWYLDELECFLDFMKNYNDCQEILILNYQKQELPACIFKYEVDDLTLYPYIREVIALKTKDGIKILLYVAKHLEAALIHIMKRFRPGMTDNQLEAWFTFFMTYKSNFENLTFFISLGDNYLDYNYHKTRISVSKRQKVFEEGELCIIEVGACYFGHRLSLGVVLPVSENFDEFQRTAYIALLRMRLSISRVLKADTPVKEIQETAEKSIIEIFIQSKLLYGTVEGAFENGVGKLFIPSGLIRSMDNDCEDPKVLELGKTYLVQPGCYLTKRWMDEAYKDEIFKLYLTPELRMYENIVVKISDPIIITTYGFRYLTNIPRSWCTIRDMRLVDQSKRSDFTVIVEKENLTVKPSSFYI